MTIPGMATAEGTKRFAARFANVAPGHFRLTQEWTVSSLGLGTYPGKADEVVDDMYAAAIVRAVELGCNVFDTAVAYRHQRSERVIGQTLAKLIADGKIRRDEVVISTKAGFMPFDSNYPGEMWQYYEEMFIKGGIVTAADFVAPGHCLTPKFLRHQIETSLCNLNCATIDIYYLHNPETQLRGVERKEFYTRLLAAFEVMERAVEDGRVGKYGISTWTGFRATLDSKDYLSLIDLVGCAKEVGGNDHHFRAIMLPLNLTMTEGFALYNQKMERENEPVSLLEVAQDLGFTVMAGSSLNLGRLTRDLSKEIHTALNDGLTTEAQQALQFTRSTPGITTALVGMSDPAHVEENLALAKVPPVSEDRFLKLFIN